MACHAFMFLDRAFDKDEERMNRILEYYANCGEKYQLLLFPEGTDKCPLATARSKTHAEKTGLVHYDYLLHPRVRGFSHILNKMRSLDYIDNLYDVTVAYPESIVQSELDLAMSGACPKEIHFDIRKIDPRTLPTDEAEIGRWLTNLWEEKEERLRRFYEANSRAQFDAQLDSLPGDVEFRMSRRSFIVQFLLVIGWWTMTAVWMYSFFTLPHQWIIALLTCSLFLGTHYVYGGFENFVMMYSQFSSSSAPQKRVQDTKKLK